MLARMSLLNGVAGGVNPGHLIYKLGRVDNISVEGVTTGKRGNPKNTLHKEKPKRKRSYILHR